MWRCVIGRVLPDVSKEMTAIIFMDQDSSRSSWSWEWMHSIHSKRRKQFHSMTLRHFLQKRTCHMERVLSGLWSPVVATHVTAVTVKTSAPCPQCVHLTPDLQNNQRLISVQGRQCYIWGRNYIFQYYWNSVFQRVARRKHASGRSCDRPSRHRFPWFPLSSSKWWHVSQDSKLLLHASYATLPIEIYQTYSLPNYAR